MYSTTSMLVAYLALAWMSCCHALVEMPLSLFRELLKLNFGVDDASRSAAKLAIERQHIGYCSAMREWLSAIDRDADIHNKDIESY